MLNTFALNAWYPWLLRKDLGFLSHECWWTSTTILQQPVGPVEILGTRWSLPLPLLPAAIPSNSLFFSLLKINKCKFTCDFQDADHCYRARNFPCPSVLPFRSPKRNLDQQLWEQKVQGHFLCDGNGLLAKTFCFLEAEKSRSEVFFPNLSQNYFLVKDFIRHYSI